MKKNLLLILLFLNVKICLAQKFAYVDSKYILEKIPAYIEAKEELDNLSFKWAEEIEALYENIDQMYKKYQIDKLLLTQKNETD
jgi:outer membrane protein